MRRAWERRRGVQTLGQVAHRWAHDALMLARDADIYDAPDLRSSWLVALGRYSERSALYPPPSVTDAISRREQAARDQQRILEAVRALQDWPEHGERLYRTIMAECILGTAAPELGRGWRHSGPGYAQAASYWSNHRQFRDAFWRAWEIVGVLVADEGTLAEAVHDGLADKRAVAWAKERGG